jgi:phospholipid-binding lipoprotein MlaA
MTTVVQRYIRFSALAAAGVLLLTPAIAQNDPRDPYENFNRAMFSFNEGLDKAVMKPVATAYEAVLPTPVRASVSNFYGNIADVFIAVNNLLQGKPADAIGDAARVIFNSTMGLFGLIDIASAMGIEKHDEDFGQTLGRWGAEPGPYLVLPGYGPRNIRDGFGLVLDVVTDPLGKITPVSTRNTLVGVRFINQRADLLAADKIIEEAAIDKYAYLRDAYLQRRRSLVYDGRSPREDDDDE